MNFYWTLRQIRLVLIYIIYIRRKNLNSEYLKLFGSKYTKYGLHASRHRHLLNTIDNKLVTVYFKKNVQSKRVICEIIKIDKYNQKTNKY